MFSGGQSGWAKPDPRAWTGLSMVVGQGGCGPPRVARGHGPATRRPAFDGRLPIDRPGQVCWADKITEEASEGRGGRRGASTRLSAKFYLGPRCNHGPRRSCVRKNAAHKAKRMTVTRRADRSGPGRTGDKGGLAAQRDGEATIGSARIGTGCSGGSRVSAETRARCRALGRGMCRNIGSDDATHAGASP